MRLDRKATGDRVPPLVLGALAVLALVVRLAYLWTVRAEPLLSDASMSGPFPFMSSARRGLVCVWLVALRSDG